jgi:hypothetical protein
MNRDILRQIALCLPNYINFFLVAKICNFSVDPLFWKIKLQQDYPSIESPVLVYPYHIIYQKAYKFNWGRANKHSKRIKDQPRNKK